jgi:hypothetical protein
LLVESRSWLTLGNYPDMSLAEARVEARQARVQLDKQQDPIALRRAVQAEQLQRVSFEQLCEDWYRSEIVGRGLKHPGVPRRYLDKYLLPKLRRLTAAEGGTKRGQNRDIRNAKDRWNDYKERKRGGA